MTSGDVALQIGRALWLTRVHEAVQRTIHTLFDMLGIPNTPELQAQIGDILAVARWNSAMEGESYIPLERKELRIW
jgi:hypothetical protein